MFREVQGPAAPELHALFLQNLSRECADQEAEEYRRRRQGPRYVCVCVCVREREREREIERGCCVFEAYFWQ